MMYIVSGPSAVDLLVELINRWIIFTFQNNNFKIKLLYLYCCGPHRG